MLGLGSYNAPGQCWTAGSAADTAWVNAGSFCSQVVAVNQGPLKIGGEVGPGVRTKIHTKFP